jgi:DnaJ like chaperone protein
MAQALSLPNTLRRWRGKLAGGALVGGAAGALVGGPLGALLGAVAGHAYDRYRKAFAALQAVQDAAAPEVTRNNAQHAAFTIGIIALGARLAHMNRRLDTETIETFRRTFGLPIEQVPVIRKMFERALFDAVGFRPYAQQLAELFAARPDILEDLVRGLARFARADGEASEGVSVYLRQLAGIFGISDADIMRIMLAEGVLRNVNSAKDACAVLGVPAGAPEIVVKQAYRTLMHTYHPDKLAMHARDAAELAAANDRVAAITSAYNEIKKQRGWV